LVTASIVLALLYIGRAVLIPLALAIMLSLLLAPLVRSLRRLRLGQTPSVLVAVLLLTLLCTAAAVGLGAQVLRIAEGLPQYEGNVQSKLKSVEELTVGRLSLLASEAGRLIGADDPSSPPLPQSATTGKVPITPLQLIAKLARNAGSPIEAVGIVLLVLTFVLLEHESLRDRLIRIGGVTDIHATTLALNDAGERLSRFFVSQFAINLSFGVAIWGLLSFLRVPEAMLCGTLAGLMRFVPYVGLAISALFATALAFAVDAGWSMAVSTLGVFVLLDVVTSQLIEPRLYGHATGLSPLSVVVAAIFWSSIWGPVGLILSTPLTLCLLVVGKHVKSLNFLELLLGDVQPLTLGQKFYQRALSGDSQEILANARAFLRHDSLATYCDRVLLSALQLAHLDVDIGATTEKQQIKIRRVVIDVVSALTNPRLDLPRPRLRSSVLESSTAAGWLRQQREQLSGRWQGPLSGPPGSVVICLGVGSSADDLAAELLVRLLRTQSFDARHFSPADLEAGLPSGADPAGVSLVYLVSAFPGPERAHAEAIGKQVRKLLPQSSVVNVFCPGLGREPDSEDNYGESPPVISSLVQAVQLCISSKAAAATAGSQPEISAFEGSDVKRPAACRARSAITV
jgi:predicted PurR-regulated permease PerM